MIAVAQSKRAACLLCLTLTACNWQRKPKSLTSDWEAQKQFFYRLDSPDLYAPEPLLEKLDIDDKVLRRQYADDPRVFQKKLDEMHVDINTVLVKPNPAPIRILALEESQPVKLWRLFLLTGNDTATQLEDGIHVRRQGFPEQILGGHARSSDMLKLHSEMGAILWRRDRSGAWKVEQEGKSRLWQVSVSEIHEIKKHEDLGVAFHVDCAALRKFGRPLQPGETTREMIAKVDVAATPAERLKFPRGQVCDFNITRTPLEW